MEIPEKACLCFAKPGWACMKPPCFPGDPLPGLPSRRCPLLCDCWGCHPCFSFQGSGRSLRSFWNILLISNIILVLVRAQSVRTLFDERVRHRWVVQRFVSSLRVLFLVDFVVGSWKRTNPRS